MRHFTITCLEACVLASCTTDDQGSHEALAGGYVLKSGEGENVKTIPNQAT